MTRKRSKEEMMEAILRIGREQESTVSQITQLVVIPWGSWKELSAALLKKGLIMHKDGHYRTTDKGLEWLRLREKITDL